MRENRSTCYRNNNLILLVAMLLCIATSRRSSSSRSLLFSIQETKAFSFTSVINHRKRNIRYHNRLGSYHHLGPTSTTTKIRNLLDLPLNPHHRFQSTAATTTDQRIASFTSSSSSILAMSTKSPTTSGGNKISGKGINSNMEQEKEKKKGEDIIHVPLGSSSSSSQVDNVLIPIHHLKYTIESTQDEIKRILLEREENSEKKVGSSFSSSLLSSSLVVIANNQTNGRGTNGRQWVCQEHRKDEGDEEAVMSEKNPRSSANNMNAATANNLYYTCAIPMDCIQPMSMIPLLPLGVGSVVGKCIKETIIKLELEGEAPRHEHQQDPNRPQQKTDEDNQSSTSASEKVRVKWPNDILLDNRKVAGILIENYQLQSTSSSSSSTWWWLIGIGINVESYPKQLIKDQNDYHSKPRSATCIREHINTTSNRGTSSSSNNDTSDKNESISPQATESNQEKQPEHSAAIELGIEITKGICDLMETRMMMSPTSSSTFSSPSSSAAEQIVNEWKSLSMEFGQKYTIRDTGEVVSTIDVESDGRMKVIGQDGIERLLSVDYLY